MWTESEIVFVVLSFLIPLIGVCGVTAARLRALQHRKKRDFFVLLCFAVVGIASVLLMQCGNGCWLALATTMPLMAVGATLDLKKSPRPAAF